jgi:hypothetical protein
MTFGQRRQFSDRKILDLHFLPCSCINHITGSTIANVMIAWCPGDRSMEKSAQIERVRLSVAVFDM